MRPVATGNIRMLLRTWQRCVARGAGVVGVRKGRCLQLLPQELQLLLLISTALAHILIDALPVFCILGSQLKLFLHPLPGLNLVLQGANGDGVIPKALMGQVELPMHLWNRCNDGWR